MKHTNTYLFLLVLCLSIFLGLDAQAQTGMNANITTTVILSPNPSPYLSDWQSSPQTILVSAKLDQPLNEPVKLLAQLTLNGQIVASTNFQKMPTISLHQGMNTFNAAQLIPYQAVDIASGSKQSSERTGRLQEGSYQLCVWFVNAETAKMLGATSCNTFSIRDVQPPVLLSPSDGAMLSSQPTITKLKLNSTKPFTLTQLLALDKNELTNLSTFEIISNNNHFICARPDLTRINSGAMNSGAMNSSINQPNSNNNFASRLMEDEGIYYYFRYEMKEVMVSGYSTSSGGDRPQESLSPNFTWLPPMPVPQTPVKYKLRIVPVYPGQSAQQVITTATPAIEKQLTVAFWHDEDNLNSLRTVVKSNPQAHFAWAVQATDLQGNSIGKNNGWSEVRMFDIAGDPDFDLLRIKKDTTKKVQPTSDGFFDVFTTVDSPKVKEPCPYKYRVFKRKFYTPCVNGMKSKYEVWGVFTCSLWKGHGGPHHGTIDEVFVLIGSIGCDPQDDNNGKTPTEPVPPRGRVIKRDSLEKIPTREEADKAEARDLKIAPPVKCPQTEKKLLRTVAGSWKKIKTEVVSLSSGTGTYAKAHVTWQRTIWNVSHVSHCILLKGHAGAHKMDAGSDIYEKAFNITITTEYGEGESQTPPAKAPSDELPQEDPK